MKLRVAACCAVLTLFLASGASAQDCRTSAILSPTPFMGNNDEVFKLADGTVWQVKFEYEYLYEYYPSVVICPSRGVLLLKGKSLNVQQLSGSTSAETRSGPTRSSDGWSMFEETNLEGSISGTVQQGRIFKTTSGNLYEVAAPTLQLVLELQPSVLVLRNGTQYKLIVDGFDEPLICRLLNARPNRTGSAVPPLGSTASYFESRIEGEFSGWNGETIIKLVNGQVWQQSEYVYTYHYAYRPEVVVYQSGGSYKMKVNGVDSAVGVRRIR